MDNIFDLYIRQNNKIGDINEEDSRRYVYNFFDAANAFADDFNDRKNEYNMIKNNKKLISQIAFSQFVYEDFLKTKNRYDLQEGDFTFLVCGFIKAVER